jgi:ankyrin repeat protein
MRARTLMLAAGLVATAGSALAQAVTVGGKSRPPAGSDAALTDSLASAVMSGSLEQVQALLKAGADPNAVGNLRKPALRLATGHGCMMAAEKDVLAVVDALLAAGADVNHVDDFGLGVLLMASQKCKGPVVTRLLKAGADAEQRNPQGMSPLAMAFVVQNYDAAEALVDHGARLSRASIAKLFDEPPADAKAAALVKRATAAK